ncbi:MAG: zinc-dependent peptidase [Euzebya sp.]
MRLFGRSEPVIDLDQAIPVIARRVPHYDRLSQTERERLLDAVDYLLSRPRWEPVNDFELTSEMIATIAGFAALLVIGLGPEVYRDLRDIVIHPRTIIMTGQRRIDRWVVADGPQAVLGHTAYSGPVHIAWNAVTRDVRDPERGHNVVLHEFAHRLDLTNGWVDGTPEMSADQRRRWVAVLQEEFDALRAQSGSPLLREYAATNPGEFFAVVTEVFFSQPLLQQDRPELYQVLAAYYRQDPATRLTPDVSDPSGLSP